MGFLSRTFKKKINSSLGRPKKKVPLSQIKNNNRIILGEILLIVYIYLKQKILSTCREVVSS